MPPPSSRLDQQPPFDAAVFAGGGCRCFWQAGFWSVAAPALNLQPKAIGATSAGAAFACAAAAGALDAVLENFKQRVAANARNLYPGNALGGAPVFPHETIYRATIHEALDDSAFARLKAGPDVRVFMVRPPSWLGASSGAVVGLLAYELERRSVRRVHPQWGRRLGFRGEVVSASTCANGAELADLILQASCTPPITPLYRRDGGIVLDGGLVDNVPVEAVEGTGNTLVLLSRPYRDEEIPIVAGRTYVQPSRPTPVAKWDYTSPDLVQQTYDLGRQDGERFVADFGSEPRGAH